MFDESLLVHFFKEEAFEETERPGFRRRVIDGADGARFLRWVCAALENPFVVLLEG